MQGFEATGYPERISDEDIEFARHVLLPGALPSEEPEPGIYDERWAAVQDAIDAKEKMRQSYRSAAELAGIYVNEADVQDWRPNDADLLVLRNQLTVPRQRLQMIEGLGLFIDDQSLLAEMQGVPLRKFQREPIEATHEFLIHAPRNEWGGKSGIIESPTASGKTAIFASMVAQLKYGETAEEPIRTLILVPTQRILEQTIGEGGERGFGKFAPHIEVGAYYQYAKELDKEVVAMTIPMFNMLVATGAMPYFPTVIVDEPHLFLGDVTSANLKEYIKDKIAIGLDATPEYDEERSAYNIFTHQIYQSKLRESIKAGRLAEVVGYHEICEPEVDPRDVPTDRKERRRYMWEARLEARMRRADVLAKRYVSMGIGGVVRTPAGDDIQYAVDYAARLNNLAPIVVDGVDRWIQAWPVGGSLARQSKQDRDLIFKMFDRGDADVLTTVKAIGVGWDGPRAKFYIDLSDTTSPVVMRQFVGRVLRLILGVGEKPVRAFVHTFVNPELGKRQYSCLDALESKNGEVITHEEAGEAPIPVARRYRRKYNPELLSVNQRVVGEIAVAHEADVELPDNLEVMMFVDTLKSDTISFEDACDVLCLDPALLKKIFKNNRINYRRPIPVNELSEILYEAPIIVPELVPGQGFTASSDVAVLADKPVRMLSVMAFGRRRGIQPLRFQKPDGSISLYYRDGDVETILGWIADGTYRQP